MTSDQPSPVLQRRKFVVLLVAAILTSSLSNKGLADGGGSNSGSGGGNSGSGSGNSGGGDDGGDDDGDDNHGDDDDDPAESDEDDQDRARNAVKKGKAVPLSALLKHLKENYPGKLINVSLVKTKGNYYYKVKLLNQSGHLVNLRFDAKSLQVVSG